VTTQLYVGNLPFAMKDQELYDLFSGKIKVEKARVVKDKLNGRSKGYGFVDVNCEMGYDDLLSTLGELESSGRKLKVGQAVPPKKISTSRPSLTA